MVSVWDSTSQLERRTKHFLYECISLEGQPQREQYPTSGELDLLHIPDQNVLIWKTNKKKKKKIILNGNALYGLLLKG